MLVRSILLVLGLLFASTAHAAPKAELWDKWIVFDAASTKAVDHAPWDAFLKKYVQEGSDGLNRFDYGGVSSADKAILDRYVTMLAETQVSTLVRPEQMAYWINLYNALTIKVVLDHYPVDGIRDIDISPGFFSSGPWGKKLLEIEGEGVSLDDIEHRILRPIWQDPRIHYAVNCASVGCPNLIARAFLPNDLDEVLTANAKAFINTPRGVAVSNGEITVSSIYDWFQDDFGGNETGVIAHLKQYAEGATLAALKNAKSIEDYEYDWSLNRP